MAPFSVLYQYSFTYSIRMLLLSNINALGCYNLFRGFERVCSLLRFLFFLLLIFFPLCTLIHVSFRKENDVNIFYQGADHSRFSNYLKTSFRTRLQLLLFLQLVKPRNYVYIYYILLLVTKIFVFVIHTCKCCGRVCCYCGHWASETKMAPVHRIRFFCV